MNHTPHPTPQLFSRFPFAKRPSVLCNTTQIQNGVYEQYIPPICVKKGLCLSLFKGHASKRCNTGVCHHLSLIVHKVGLNGLIYIVSILFVHPSVQNKQQHVVKNTDLDKDRTDHSPQHSQRQLYKFVIIDIFYFRFFKTPVSHADYKVAVMALLYLILSLRYLFFFFA